MDGGCTLHLSTNLCLPVKHVAEKSALVLRGFLPGFFSSCSMWLQNSSDVSSGTWLRVGLNCTWSLLPRHLASRSLISSLSIQGVYSVTGFLASW